MSLVDIFILVILVSFAVIGFMRGVFKSLVAFVGFLIIIVVAYLFKNILGDILITNLPFFKFNIGGGSVVMNIILYQSIAFIVILIILGIVYRILLTVTGIFEKILRITIILGIPSKLLGLVVGTLEGFIIVYLALFFLTQPYIKMDILNESKYAGPILKHTPILSSFAESTVTVINEVNDTMNAKDDSDFDLKLTELILKNKVADANLLQKLIDSKKIEVEGIQEVVNKYKNSGVSE